MWVGVDIAQWGRLEAAAAGAAGAVAAAAGASEEEKDIVEFVVLGERPCCFPLDFCRRRTVPIRRQWQVLYRRRQQQSKAGVQ